MKTVAFTLFLLFALIIAKISFLPESNIQDKNSFIFACISGIAGLTILKLSKYHQKTPSL